MLARLLFDPNPTEGNGTATAEGKPEGSAPDLAKVVEGLLTKHGDASGALKALVAENFNYRTKLRETKAKLPPEGSVVLAGDDAKDWGHYRQLGKPSDLKKSLGERDQFHAEVAGFRKAEVVRQAAEVAKYKPSVLMTLARDLEIAVVDGKDKFGKPARVAVVKGDGDEATPLDQYAEAHWGDFLPALKGDAADASRVHGTPVGRQGRPMPPIQPDPNKEGRPRMPLARI